MSDARRGIKLSKETKRKLSEAHKGEKAWNWKGGVNPLTVRIRACFQYRQWRSDVFTRDNFTCQKCWDSRGGNLNAHHIKPLFIILEEYKIETVDEALNCEELWNINNGITLCKRCHQIKI